LIKSIVTYFLPYKNQEKRRKIQKYKRIHMKKVEGGNVGGPECTKIATQF
jgi:hypothetical protein